MIVPVIMWAIRRPVGFLVGTFGEKFREERERRGFTLDDISSVTKINSRMLQAIEQEQFSVLPGGVFNKGFVRAYAKHLGLNPEQAIAEYLTALRQAQLAAEAAAWDQPLPPPKTIPSPTPPTPPKPPAAESKSKIVESNSPAASLHWTNAQHAVSAPLPPSASPSSSSGSTPELPLPKESLDKPPLQESPLPRPLVQPPPIAPPIIAPSTTQPPSPPPLWIPPSPTAKASMIANSKPATSTPQSSPTSSPLTPSSTQPATVPAITFPGILPKQLPPSFTPQPTPQSPVADPPPSHPAVKKTTSVPTPHPPAPAAPWKLPAVILTVAAIVIAALLSTRHSHSATTVTAPVQINYSPSAQPVATIAPPAPSNPAKAAIPPTHVAASQLSTDSDARPSSVAAATAPTITHAASPKPPTQFRLSLRATENCSISITADGELVTRENLIAPANATVKATHEIVVQVSNAAAVTFRINDRQISTQGTEAAAQAKTFIFDSTGLRTPEQKSTNPIR